MAPYVVLYCFGVAAFFLPAVISDSAGEDSDDIKNLEAALQKLAAVMDKIEATMAGVQAMLAGNEDDYLSHAEMVDKGILPALGAELLMKFGFVWDILRTAAACSTSLLVIVYILFEAAVTALLYWWTGGHIYSLSIYLLTWNSASLILFGLLAGMANRWRVRSEPIARDSSIHNQVPSGYGTMA